MSFSRGEYRDDPNERRSMVRSVSTGGGYSGTGYDQSVRARAAASGPGSTDTPLNKLQYKYWVTKSKVVRKLGKEEDELGRRAGRGGAGKEEKTGRGS